MSSRRRGRSGAKLPTAGLTDSSKGKTVPQVSDRWAGQVADGASSQSLKFEKNGVWEEVGRRPINRSFVNAGCQNPSVEVSGNPWTGAKEPSNAWPGTKQPVSAGQDRVPPIPMQHQQQRCGVFFSVGRVLNGYMAEKGDIDIFYQHSRGKPLVKFEMRSYEEMVVNSVRQMSEDNNLLSWYKNIAVKEKKYAKALEDSFGSVSEKLRKTQEENCIVRQEPKCIRSNTRRRKQ